MTEKETYKKTAESPLYEAPAIEVIDVEVRESMLGSIPEIPGEGA